MGDGTTCHYCRQSSALCECPDQVREKAREPGALELAQRVMAHPHHFDEDCAPLAAEVIRLHALVAPPPFKTPVFFDRRVGMFFDDSGMIISCDDLADYINAQAELAARFETKEEETT
jgi:hypothetical protein